MATCANCIHHSLCDYNTNISGNGKIRLVYAEGADVKCSFFQNTADAAPKSEVERLGHILNCYALQYGTVKDQHEVIDKAKTDVAREIFEEIEKMLENQEVVTKNQREKELGDWIFHNYIPRKVAELKKKYTEGKSD